MAAEDYIDWDDDLDFERLFEPPSNKILYKGRFKGRFYQKGLDSEFIEDHYFIGFCVVLRETEKSILCRFIDDEEVNESAPTNVGVRKWSTHVIRWVPRSQIADQTRTIENNDELSLNPLSEAGVKGNLWISGWLKDKWDEEGVQI